MEKIILLLIGGLHTLRGGGSYMLYAPGEDGQGMTEFGVIIMLVAMVVIILLILMGPSIGNMFSNVVADI
jgi:Flp pilus assembly pilin Flp